MSSLWRKDNKWPDRHYAITPSDTVNLPQSMVVVALTAGTAAIVDKDGTVITYTLEANQAAPCLAIRVNATNTTATVAGLH